MDYLKHAKNLSIEKIEIWEDMPFFQVFRKCTKKEYKRRRDSRLAMKKKWPDNEEFKNSKDDMKYLIGQFNSLELAENYKSLIESNNKLVACAENVIRHFELISNTQDRKFQQWEIDMWNLAEEALK